MIKDIQGIDLEYYSDVIPYWENTRDIGKFSDHLTVWLDLYIGRPEECVTLKAKFQRIINPLTDLSQAERELNEPCYQLEDPEILTKLKDTVYCLKPFFDINDCLEFIRQNPEKKIFFISSGTMGEKIVPQIAEWQQIHGIYIFCGNIEYQIERWAMDYCDHITSILNHQDDLLLRLTIDIAKYLEEKGDHYLAVNDTIKVKHCYAWAMKLLLRTRDMGSTNYRDMHDKLMRKFDNAEASCEESEKQGN
ncbi:unnamed protein product [Didymodactylos carnosus]|uniref:Uncharacterized protein n=1 Tax=Didymodactylos carnosus TaxID=1234261 RepID=A0A8S2FWC3_9BILA|nr:unnamed protein product [Didymodactylos carnosus]CAF4358883.1 unnamed protein product [Didymodactylos carnosus]